jgi:dinuclear metal center YbgI/SA1388 family protein
LITLQDLSAFLDSLLLKEPFVDPSPNGLQVEGKKEIKKIAFAVSASLEIIEKAVDVNADALIVHHGLFWKGESPEIKGSKRAKLSALLQEEVSLFGYHLPLDAHREVGNNWKAARDLGWKNIEPFPMYGVMGKFEEIAIGDFIAKLEEYYDHKATTSLGGRETVQSAALISGGAYRYLDEAIKAKVDCFITGNFDEPAWHLARDEKIHFIALGHHATERIGVMALKEHIESQLRVKGEWIDVPNPF